MYDYCHGSHDSREFFALIYDIVLLLCSTKMEPHDAHELALNRAFEERWQRRLERPRSVAALTALQYRERKKYELAWYKTETIQLTEQIEHLQNRLSFLMDQNTSLNLECQKLRKRVAQLENLCRDQLKNLVSRPLKSTPGGSPSTSQTSGAAMIQNIIDMEEDGDDPEDEVEPADAVPKKSAQQKNERESEDALEKAAADALTSLGSSGKKRHMPQTSAQTATSTVRRGIRIVKQRSPSGKTTIVAAASSTAGQSSSSMPSSVPVVQISPNKNSSNIGHVASVRSTSGRSGVSPPQKQRILIPKRLISYTSGGGQSAGLRLIQPVSTAPVKVKASGSDAIAEGRNYLGKESRAGGSSSKRYSSDRRSLKDRDGRIERSASPVKTPPEVIISDEGSSDAEAREKRPRSGPRPGIRFSDGRKILAAAAAAASSSSSVMSEHRETTKRKLHGHSKSNKRVKSDNDVS